jgi:hypothetical protein
MGPMRMGVCSNKVFRGTSFIKTRDSGIVSIVKYEEPLGLVKLKLSTPEKSFTN